MEDLPVPTIPPFAPDEVMDLYLTIWQCPACATLTRMIDLQPANANDLACPVCMAVVLGEDDQ